MTKILQEANSYSKIHGNLIKLFYSQVQNCWNRFSHTIFENEQSLNSIKWMLLPQSVFKCHSSIYY